MKVKKSLIISIIAIVLIAIIVIIVLNVIKEKKDTEDNIMVIKNNYEILSNKVKEYNLVREEYHDMRANFTIDNYLKEHETYQNVLIKYNNVMKEIDGAILNINSKCGREYIDSNVNDICNTYKELYEKIVNLYVSDLFNYNKVITEYNLVNDDKLDFFEMVHSDYIDYNNDNKFEGRENNE